MAGKRVCRLLKTEKRKRMHPLPFPACLFLHFDRFLHHCVSAPDLCFSRLRVGARPDVVFPSAFQLCHFLRCCFVFLYRNGLYVLPKFPVRAALYDVPGGRRVLLPFHRDGLCLCGFCRNAFQFSWRDGVPERV